MNDKASASKNRRKRRGRKNAFGQLKALLSRRKLRGPIGITEDHVLSILIARRGREALLGPGLFSEPAWDVLLELYAAKLGCRKMFIADLARATETPESTTARWISVLSGRGLVAPVPDTIESNGPWITLTDEGVSKMKSLTDHWGAAFLSI